jgi:tetratricopeptide (TPR) repeat protein
MAEIDEFLKQVLAEQKELNADPTPQTPVYALLAEGKLEEAEAVAREAVSDLERGNVVLAKNAAVVQPENVIPKSVTATLHEQNSTAENNSQPGLLSEALIAHGIALARLKKWEAAQAILERAIAVAQEAGAPEKAGLAALTMIEELEHLSRETLLSAYEQANAAMESMRNRKLQGRVIDAAKKVMTSLWGEMDPDRALKILLTPPLGWQEHMLGDEEKSVKQVLNQSDANTPETASVLPRTSEGLVYIIELRPEPSLKRRTSTWCRSPKD